MRLRLVAALVAAAVFVLVSAYLGYQAGQLDRSSEEWDFYGSSELRPGERIDKAVNPRKEEKPSQDEAPVARAAAAADADRPAPIVVDNDVNAALQNALQRADAQPRSTARAPLSHVRRAARYEVEIWSKAAIGDYFWTDIFRGSTKYIADGHYSHGEQIVSDVRLRFRAGSGLKPANAPPTTRHVVMILNAHNPEKMVTAKALLDELAGLRHVRNVGLVVLGSELCDNQWLEPYLPFVKFVFMVYHDASMIDNDKIFEWPLGIATYRKFERRKDLAQLRLDQPREYTCNMMATLHVNTTRELLVRALERSALVATDETPSVDAIRASAFQYLTAELGPGHERLSQEHLTDKNLLANYPAPVRSCLVANRANWAAQDSKEETQHYHEALLTSQFTLCPKGLNVMCYRIFEACELGSIPIVEDVPTPECGPEFNQLTLLKAHNAPFIYVRDWNNIAAVLDNELADKAAVLKRQRDVVEWYATFKTAMRDKFMSVLLNSFAGFQD